MKSILWALTNAPDLSDSLSFVGDSYRVQLGRGPIEITLFTPRDPTKLGTFVSNLLFGQEHLTQIASYLIVETMEVNDAEQVGPHAMNAPIHHTANHRRSDSLQDTIIEDDFTQLKKESSSTKDICRRIAAIPLIRSFIPRDFLLPKVLFNVGIISYLSFSVKLLWKLSVMFQSQPHAVGVGFLVPSAAVFTFAQLERYAGDQVPGRENITEITNPILQTALDMTSLVGVFICTLIFWLGAIHVLT
ncbi:hypothetical protein F5877DRAFT_80448 [Lentinula edodes]|nr:hypothetical protein F5877DRAFT_80448 [Lentinula edodes]